MKLIAWCSTIGWPNCSPLAARSASPPRARARAMPTRLRRDADAPAVERHHREPEARRPRRRAARRRRPRRPRSASCTVDEPCRPILSSCRADRQAAACRRRTRNAVMPLCAPGARAVSSPTRPCTPAWSPLVIHCLVPSSRQPPSPSRVAVVRIAAGSRAGLRLGQRERAAHALAGDQARHVRAAPARAVPNAPRSARRPCWSPTRRPPPRRRRARAPASRASSATAPGLGAAERLGHVHAEQARAPRARAAPPRGTRRRGRAPRRAAASRAVRERRARSSGSGAAPRRARSPRAVYIAFTIPPPVRSRRASPVPGDATETATGRSAGADRRRSLTEPGRAAALAARLTEHPARHRERPLRAREPRMTPSAWESRSW